MQARQLCARRFPLSTPDSIAGENYPDARALRVSGSIRGQEMSMATTHLPNEGGGRRNQCFQGHLYSSPLFPQPPAKSTGPPSIRQDQRRSAKGLETRGRLLLHNLHRFAGPVAFLPASLRRGEPGG